MKTKKMLSLFAVLSVLILALPVFSQSGDVRNPAKAGISSDVYIVRMAEAPVVAYEGGIKGYPATSPVKGQKIDPLSPDVVRYVGYLDNRHNQALSAVGGARKLYDYRYSFNGFAAKLSPSQAEAI